MIDVILTCVICQCFSDIFKLDGSPAKLRLLISGDVRKNQAKLGGMYILAPDKVNRHRYWYSKSGYYAIWWSNEGFWLVGLYSSLGTSSGEIQGPTGMDSWPNQLSTNWKNLDFYFQTATQGDIRFIRARNSKGKIFKISHYSKN